MKLSTLFFIGIGLVLSVSTFAQVTLSPDPSLPNCPSSTAIFYNITSPNDYQNMALSQCSGCTINSNVDGGGNFSLVFTDTKAPHSVLLTDVVTGLQTTLTFAVSSLVGITPTVPAGGQPLFPTNLQYTGSVPAGYAAVLNIDYCSTTPIPFTAPFVFYTYNGNAYGVAMRTYQWKIPKGWSLNDGSTTTISTGSNTITTATNNVGITPDPINGAGSDIEVWVLNNCNSSLLPSSHLKVLIYRNGAPLPPAIAANGSGSINIVCGSTTPITFAATNPGSCVTGYLWKTTGWLYNGAPLNGQTTTTTSSITLTPDPNGTPGNVSVTYIINGAAVNADTYTESVTVSKITYNLPMTGPQVLCGGAQTYSVANLPAGASISWTVSSNLQIIGAANTSSIQVQPLVSSGSGTVQASINGNCFSSPVGDIMTVGIGIPNWSQLSIVSEGPSICPNVPVMFGARYAGNCTNFLNEGITNVTWSVAPNPAQIVSDAGTAGCSRGNNSGVTIRFNPNPTMYNVRISATNACGTSGLSNAYPVSFMPSGCPNVVTSGLAVEKQGVADDSLAIGKAAAVSPVLSRFSVSPNPSTGRILVGVARTDVSADGLQPSMIRHIDVYNSVGLLVRSLQYGTGVNGTITVDLGNVTPGIYILSILTDKGRFSEKVALIK